MAMVPMLLEAYISWGNTPRPLLYRTRCLRMIGSSGEGLERGDLLESRRQFVATVGAWLYIKTT